MRAAIAASLAVVAVAAIGGCGGEGSSPDPTEPRAGATGRGGPSTATTPRAPARPPAPRCPAEAANCSAASGRVIAIESLDPDGDGDLHVVLAGGGVTLPGVTVLDVSATLRPRQDPKIGSWAAGAGPVYEGSYGQRQIEVDEVVFAD